MAQKHRFDTQKYNVKSMSKTRIRQVYQEIKPFNDNTLLAITDLGLKPVIGLCGDSPLWNALQKYVHDCLAWMAKTFSDLD